MVLGWYEHRLPLVAFDERRVGCTTSGPSKKEVTVYFGGGFSLAMVLSGPSAHWQF